MTALQQLTVGPILLPLLTAALMLLLGEKRRPLKARLNLLSTLGGLGLSWALLVQVGTGPAGGVSVYLPGNWPVPFGIVLVADRLAALMLVLTGTLASAALAFANARWDRAGANFHALFQVQLMGLYGAFLTGDLFNLFVFFEVLLAASYGLMLHGSGRARVSSGLHYISINLLASSLFLIGAALIYGVTGTLNLADLAQKIPQVADGDVGLLHAGAAILAVAFLAKAGAWPLNFWLVPAYSAASAPVAALFAIMTKVGVYAVVRLWSLLFSTAAGASAGFGDRWLSWIGLATLLTAALSILGAQRLERLAGLSILMSAGVLLCAFGLASPALTAAALFYLVGSTLALAALFLLAELVERSRSANELPLEEDLDQLPNALESLHPPPGTNLDDEQKAVVGQVIPWTTAFLGLGFMVCALMAIGMPPLAGFIGKLALIRGTLDSSPALEGSLFVALLVLSGLASLFAFGRAGIQRFWTPGERPPPLLRLNECLPVLALLGVCVLLTIKGEALLRYTTATADALHQPQRYIEAVLGAEAVAAPGAPTGEVQP